jgi:hypothetical protein
MERKESETVLALRRSGIFSSQSQRLSIALSGMMAGISLTLVLLRLHFGERIVWGLVVVVAALNTWILLRWQREIKRQAASLKRFEQDFEGWFRSEVMREKD